VKCLLSEINMYVYYFRILANIEAKYAIKHGLLMELSEQQLLDCDKMSNGCKGGLPSSAIVYDTLTTIIRKYFQF
jgi:hypothetical protein